ARRTGRPARAERHAEARDGAEAIGTQQGRVPGDRRTPVVPDDGRALGPERIENPDHVAHEMEKRVALDRVRTVGLTIAAHVRRDGSKARFRERLELMAPRVPRLRPAVAEENERPLAGFGAMNADAVRL